MNDRNEGTRDRNHRNEGTNRRNEGTRERETLCKLLEKVVHYQIISYLDDNNYLSFNQHGFRKGKSTSTAILETTCVLMDNYNRGKHTSCVFVDYKKAFETLDHKILLRKLIDYDVMNL